MRPVRPVRPLLLERETVRDGFVLNGDGVIHPAATTGGVVELEPQIKGPAGRASALLKVALLGKPGAWSAWARAPGEDDDEE